MLIVALVLAGALWFGRADIPPLPAIDSSHGTGVASPKITIHVSGAVVEPGLVELSSRARVADALAAAGGVRLDSDVAALNLAAPVRDGEQIVVPFLNADPGAARNLGIAADGRVRINVASAQELQRLPGVGPVLAERIVSFRDQHGLFSAIEDLLDVAGIGEGKLAQLADAAVVP